MIENERGEIVGVEVKAGASLAANDLRGLRRFADIAGDRLIKGILLYDGQKYLPLGGKFCAAPFSSVWGSVDNTARAVSV